MVVVPAAELRLLSRRGAACRYHHGRPLRSHVFAYAQPTRRQGQGATPREVLGVEQDADPQEIKTAFRKLALKYHPDHQGGDEGHFVEILRAYEILVGKTDGKDGTANADWDFHDWYWQFAKRRSQGQTAATGAPVKADLKSQLAGLRQRAAVRAAKARAVQQVDAIDMSSDPADDFQDAEECPVDSAPSSPMNEDQMRRFAEETRRRAQLGSSETKESISHQLTGLKRRAQIRMEV